MDIAGKPGQDSPHNPRLSYMAQERSFGSSEERLGVVWEEERGGGRWYLKVADIM